MSDRAEKLYEQVLVVRCQTGDEAAFEELIARYSPRLRYFLGKMLIDVSAADDALQDVWLDVVRNIVRLRETAAFTAWVYRIARDRAWRVVRGRRSDQVPLVENDIVDYVDIDFSVDDAKLIHDGLEKLTPEHREVLVLKFLEEMTYDDISRVVGCPVGTIRSRIHHAKRALRGILGQEFRS